MAATSVTGTGPGASGGKQKTGNHCSCKCGEKIEEDKKPVIKRGCVVSYRTGSKVTAKTGGSTRTKVCG